MSQIKLKHSGGNSSIIAAPSSNPASDVTLKLPSTTGSAGQILKVASANHSSTNAELEFASGGKLIKYVSVTKKDVASNATASLTWWSYTDNSLKVTLTPSSASNKIYLTAFFNIMEVTSQWLQFRFEQDGSQIDETVGDAAGNRTRVTGQHMAGNNATGGRFYMMAAEVNAGSTSSRTYNLGFRHTSSSTKTLILNRTGDDLDNVHYGRSISTLTAMEIEP